MKHIENILQRSTVLIASNPSTELPLLQRGTVWIFLAILFSAFTAKSQIVNSLPAGTNNWNLTTTWDCGCIPGAANDVIIHHVVTIGAAVNAQSVTIINDAAVNASLSLLGGTSTIGAGGIQVIGGATAFNSDLILSNNAILIINGDLQFTNSITGNSAAALRLNNTSQLVVNGDFSYSHQSTDAVAETRTEIGINNSSIFTITGDLLLTYNSIIKNSTLSFLSESNSQIHVGGDLKFLMSEAGNTGRIAMQFGTGSVSTASLTIAGDLGIYNNDTSAPFSASRNVFEIRDLTSVTIYGDLTMVALPSTAVARSNRLRVLDNSRLTLGGDTGDLLYDPLGGDLVFSSATTTVTDNRPEIGNVGGSAIFDIKGNVINPGHGRIETGGSSSFYFSGSTPQVIPQVNNSNDYFNIRINNSSGVAMTLQGSTSIAGNLEMLNGIINTVSSDRLQVTAAATSNGGTSSSYIVNGLTKLGGGSIILPIGAGARWAPIQLSNITGASDFFTAFEVNYNGSGPANTTTDGTFDHVSGSEFWDIEIISALGTGQPPAPPTSAAITFYWKDACRSQIGNVSTAPQDLFIGGFVSANNQWEPLPSTIDPSSETCDPDIDTETGNITVNLTGALLTSNSSYTFIAINPFSNPLPVELISFEVSENAFKEAMIEWETASEVNSWKFIVEKSGDGKVWKAINEVEGLGTSNIGKEYSVIDSAPFAETTYYRIVQYDFDGIRTYSSIKSLALGSEYELNFNYYPNPAKDILHIISGKQLRNVDVVIVNMNGAIVLHHHFSEFSWEQSILLTNLNAGLYYVTLVEKGRKLNSDAIVINRD